MKQLQKDIIISSRVRLARNAAGLPFPMLLGGKKARELVDAVYSALSGRGGFGLYPVDRMDALDGQMMKEKHLISSDLLQSQKGGAVILNEAETISVMVNEEDHIRIQCILGGFNFSEAYKIADLVDDDIAKKISYAYDPRLGYLTACPTNLGTGMRVSAMMFLPGLLLTGGLDGCLRAISRLNMTIRGVYGEGSESTGYLYQVSNQRTLGSSETDIVDAVGMSVGHIEDAERKARDILMAQKGAELIDRILRAYGVLTNAYQLSIAEFMQLIALVKLGVYYGQIRIADSEGLEKLIVAAQPASLAGVCGKERGQQDLDLYRAAFVSKALKQLIKQ